MAGAVVGQRETPDGVIVDLRGELDMSTDEGLKSLLVDIASRRRTHRIVVDMRLVTFVDSTGIGALIAGHNAASAHGIDFVVRDIAPFIEEQLRITGVYQTLTGNADTSRADRPAEPSDAAEPSDPAEPWDPAEPSRPEIG